jgi:hypothetical protein
MPGVSLDRGAYESFAETFENDNSDMMYGQSSEIDCHVDNVADLALEEDCAWALGAAMLNPVAGLLQGRNGGQWWAAVSLST